MPEGWIFRPGTVDQTIYNGVVGRNEYHLPDRFLPSDVVIDVGAHIGSFAHAVVQRGCRQVYCFEPDGDNCRLADLHLRDYIDAGWVRLSRAAMWRSDANDDDVRFDGYQMCPKSFAGMEGILNTGNGSVLWGTGEAVAKIGLDDVIDEVLGNEALASEVPANEVLDSEVLADGIRASGARRVRLLKLDCEGAEWPILLTSRRLHLVDEIAGEFHEIGGPYLEIGEERPATPLAFRSDRVASFTIEELARVLTESGFIVTHRRHQRPDFALEGLGMFFAVRSRP